MWRQSTRLCALAASIYAVMCRYPRIVLAKLMHQTELLKFSGGTRVICFWRFRAYNLLLNKLVTT